MRLVFQLALLFIVTVTFMALIALYFVRNKDQTVQYLINVIKKHGDHAITEEPLTFRKNEKSRGAAKKEERQLSA